jgi:uncharacterized protein with HEPN domain
MTQYDRAILGKILDESMMLSRLLDGVQQADFLENDEKMRAVCMTLINIGELVKNLKEEVRINHPSIPWKEMAGLRDVAAHGYFALRMEDIWIYAAIELPQLAEQIREIINTNPKSK